MGIRKTLIRIGQKHGKTAGPKPPPLPKPAPLKFNPETTPNKVQHKIKTPQKVTEQTNTEYAKKRSILQLRQIFQGQIFRRLFTRKKPRKVLEEYEQQKFVQKYGRLLEKPSEIGWQNPPRFTPAQITIAYQKANKKIPEIFRSGKEIRFTKINEGNLIIYPHEKAAIICYQNPEGKKEVLKVIKISWWNMVKDAIRDARTIDDLVNCIWNALNIWADYKYALREDKE